MEYTAFFISNMKTIPITPAGISIGLMFLPVKASVYIRININIKKFIINFAGAIGESFSFNFIFPSS